MKSCRTHIVLGVTLIGLLCGVAAYSTQNADADQGVTNTIEGLVRDISCPIQNKQATATTFNMKCALECARQGSPLVILTKDGVMYIPISNSMPDTDQRPRLMPYVGKYVKASGKTYERAGTRAIAIDQITEQKDVHLTTDAE